MRSLLSEEETIENHCEKCFEAYEGDKADFEPDIQGKFVFAV